MERTPRLQPLPRHLRSCADHITLHDDLLKQGRHLARREPGDPCKPGSADPSQPCYYGLFDLLLDEATGPMLPDQGRATLGPVAARAFRDATMNAVAKQCSKTDCHRRPLPSAELGPALDGQPVPAVLFAVATTCRVLQQARHDADYDVSQRIARAEVVRLVEQTTRAFSDLASSSRLIASRHLPGMLTVQADISDEGK